MIGLIMNFIITFVLLFLSRIFLKKFYNIFEKTIFEIEIFRALIYETDANVISAAENTNKTSKKVKNIKKADLSERSPIGLDNKLISKELKLMTRRIINPAASIGSANGRQIASLRPLIIIIMG